MSDDEEARRAEAWRVSRVNRHVFQGMLATKRLGSPAAELALRLKWEPLRRAFLEANYVSPPRRLDPLDDDLD